ncbi:MAG: DciA family protein [Verrucomicrobiota bacterium]|nr:DciA family protein [Verrucomicrobiota bacterium]
MTEKTHSSDDWLSRSDNAESKKNYRRISKKEYAREGILKSWYGLDLAHGEIEHHQSRVQSIETLLPEVIEEIEWSDVNLYNSILKNWGKIVGDALKNRILPVAIHGFWLYVEYSDASTSFYLREYQHILEKKIEDLTDGVIRKIKFIPAGTVR